jgi:hypothetical protein
MHALAGSKAQFSIVGHVKVVERRYASSAETQHAIDTDAYAAGEQTGWSQPGSDANALVKIITQVQIAIAHEWSGCAEPDAVKE